MHVLQRLSDRASYRGRDVGRNVEPVGAVKGDLDMCPIRDICDPRRNVGGGARGLKVTAQRRYIAAHLIYEPVLVAAYLPESDHEQGAGGGVVQGRPVRTLVGPPRCRQHGFPLLLELLRHKPVGCPASAPDEPPQQLRKDRLHEIPQPAHCEKGLPD